MKRRIAALGAIASLLLGACSSASPPGASPAASSPAGSVVPAGSVIPETRPPTGAPPSSPSATPELARLLHDAIRPDAILADLRTLERITMAAAGNRSAGSPGEAAAVEFVAGELERAGLAVTREEVALPMFRETAPGTLEILSSPRRAFDPGADFKALIFSPSGDVTARVVALGFDRAAVAGSTRGAGCGAADWVAFPAGSIALLQPGPCRTRQVVQHAQEAGAVAVVRSYPGWVSGRVLRPTLIDPSGLRIPVVAVTGTAGLAIADAAGAGIRLRVKVETETTMGRAVNLIAETPTGDPTHVVMLGAHLDSVIDGPGINDDGSGAMTALEVGRRLAALSSAGSAPAWKVRIAFWTGEEIGLWGSMDWFRRLTPAARSAIEAYVNLDMLGSPNGIRRVSQWSTNGDPSAGPLERLLGASLERDRLPWEPGAPGSSDDLAFAEAGIPTSGLFAGDLTLKTADEAKRFGGSPGRPFDPCYHLSCDTIANVNPVLLGDLARIAAWTTGFLASGVPFGH